jgi:hypothetical protein
VVAGDFDYADSPQLWELQNDNTIGPDFPLFGTVGNHDVDEWDGYQDVLVDRYMNIDGAQCEGDMGVQSECHYRGLHMLLSGVGLMGDGHEEWIAERLAADDSIWSVCLWHVNQADFNAGGKGNEAGYGVFQACMDGGALVINGHEHSYSRTMVLDDIGNPGHGACQNCDLAAPVIGEGKTFVTVSGLGGSSVRDYSANLHDDDTWWATIFTDNYYLLNGVEQDDFDPAVGSLFIDFYVDGDPNKAYAYFKTINGDVVDEFTITRE